MLMFTISVSLCMCLCVCWSTKALSLLDAGISPLVLAATGGGKSALLQLPHRIDDDEQEDGKRVKDADGRRFGGGNNDDSRWNKENTNARPMMHDERNSMNSKQQSQLQQKQCKKVMIVVMPLLALMEEQRQEALHRGIKCVSMSHSDGISVRREKEEMVLKGDVEVCSEQQPPFHFLQEDDA